MTPLCAALKSLPTKVAVYRVERPLERRRVLSCSFRTPDGGMFDDQREEFPESVKERNRGPTEVTGPGNPTHEDGGKKTKQTYLNGIVEK